MIGSLMYLTTSRPDIIFAVCACARFEVTLTTSHLLAVKRIFRYLKGNPTLGLWYSRDSPFELVAYTDSGYVGATQDRKSTTGGNFYCQAKFNAVEMTWVPNVQLLSKFLSLEELFEGRSIMSICSQVWMEGYVISKVGDEAVHKELGDKMERATTTTSSLEAEQDNGSVPRCQDTILGDVNAQIRFEITSKQSNDPPLLRVNAVRHMLMLSVQVPAAEESDGFAKIIDFMKASSVHYALTLQALVDKKRVIITESSIKRDLHLDDAEGIDCLPTVTIFEELARIGAKSTAWNEFSSTMASLIICLELTDEEKEKLFMELMVKRRKHFAALRAQEKRNLPLTKSQKRTQMSTYLKHMAMGSEVQESKEKKVEGNEETAKGSRKKMLGRKRAGKEQQQESLKKQRIEEDKESDEVDEASKDDEGELMKHLVIKKDDDIAIDAIPLATKLPVIIDYKLHKEGMLVHYQLIRADGSSKRYSSMIRMLQGIDREDLEALWKIVKTKYSDKRPEDEFERVLWGDLKVMFEPDKRSDVWRILQGYRVTIWKLIDSSGVHFVRFDNLHIFMLVEKRYPLTPITITNMLNKKLQTDHQNKMCYQLLKLMKMNIKFRGGLLGLKRLYGFLEVTTAQVYNGNYAKCTAGEKITTADYNCLKTFYCQEDKDELKIV
ncbi:hypothetical protein Tco_1182973 [Tanacetum coccineum]